ncbi:uncharacterized protein TRAVEDRAFT_76927, partial [Trametes versicolor FP-101664 SS1]|uniref:uncharacterized protein n=1 Tax=Trametes versicolor (strain FP-101664) TaxID=717944 RepID=UPI0004623C2C
QPYPISLPEDLRSITVRRELLAKRYGGSSMDTFPGPSAEKLAQHGRGNLMCINLLWNPHAPQVPGHAGLYFDTILPGDPWTARKGHSERQTLFVKIKTGKWLYLGEYEAHPAPLLTVAQWHGLADAVRGVWTKNISEKDWGRTLRARIHLRRTLGREPTRAEVDSADGLFKHVTREQVNNALGAGHECIRAWSMKCIGYDEDFQREV